MKISEFKKEFGIPVIGIPVRGRTKYNEKTVSISFCITLGISEAKELYARTDEDCVTVSSLIRRLILYYIHEHEGYK